VLGIGIIGAGRIFKAHAGSVQAIPETELVAVSDVDAERVARATATYGGAGYADYQELLRDPKVDAVVIGLPHWLHERVSIDCLRAGKHVLVEKPMAMTVAECDAMIAAAEASGKNLMVAHSQHFFPVNLEAQRIIRAGGLGNLVMATDTWYKPFHDGVRPPWFLEADKGGGMWPMNGSHMIDRLLFFLESEVVAVKAKIGNPVFGLTATDAGVAFLEFASGACATIMHVGFRDGVNRFEAEITGTEAQLKFSGDQGGGSELWLSKERKWEAISVSPLDLPTKPGVSLPASVFFAAEVREFALSILEGRPPSITGDYGRQVVRVLDACEESSRTGREVRLDTG